MLSLQPLIHQPLNPPISGQRHTCSHRANLTTGWIVVAKGRRELASAQQDHIDLLQASSTAFPPMLMLHDSFCTILYFTMATCARWSHTFDNPFFSFRSDPGKKKREAQVVVSPLCWSVPALLPTRMIWRRLDWLTRSTPSIPVHHGQPKGS
jgi:hypothetical protein